MSYKRSSNNIRRLIIHRLYCLINRETYGKAKIKRSDLRHTYDVNRWCFDVHKVNNINKKRFLSEIAYQLNCDLEERKLEGYLINDNDSKNLRVGVSENQTIDGKKYISFFVHD